MNARARHGVSRKGGRSPSRARWIALGFAALCVVAPLLLGGATDETRASILVLGAAASFACFVSLRHSRLGGVPAAVWGALLGVAWTICQTLPVPCAFLKWLQPERVELMADLARLAGREQLWCAISWAPGATLADAIAGTVLASLVVGAVTLARLGQRGLLLRGVALSSVAMACVSLAHMAADATSVFGWFEPGCASCPRVMSPLLNSNHLAGHMALGFPLCLVNASGRKIGVEAKILWMGAAAAVFLVALLTGSRAGVVATVAGGVVVIGAQYAVRMGRTHSSFRWGMAAIVFCVSVGSYVGAEHLHRDFTSDGFSKFQMIRRFAALSLERPLIGAGRGAFEDAVSGLQLGNSRVQFAENLPIHWGVEWGMPVTLAILALFAISLLRGSNLSREEFALRVGVLCLVAQNMVDFSLELAGLATVAAVALGVLCARDVQGRDSKRLRQMLLPGAVACVAATVTAPILALYSRDTLREQFANSVDSPEFEVKLRAGMLLFPTDSAFAVYGAANAIRMGAPSSPAWLNMAMRLAPEWSASHLLAAHYLESRGAIGQAATELSLAAETDRAADGTICAFLKRHPLADLAWASAPLNVDYRAKMLERFTNCLLAADSPAEADALLVRMLEEDPASLFAHGKLVDLALLRRDGELALTRARAMRLTARDAAETHSAMARALLGTNAERQALDYLTQVPGLEKSRGILISTIVAAAKLRDMGHFNSAAESLLRFHGHTSKERANLLMFLGSQLLVAQLPLEAAAKARNAYDLTGDPKALVLEHQAAVAAGRMDVALRASIQLCHLQFQGDKFCGPAARSDLNSGQPAPEPGISSR